MRLRRAGNLPVARVFGSPKGAIQEDLMAFSGLEAFFYPESVAVIGASESAGKLGHEILGISSREGFPVKFIPSIPRATGYWEDPVTGTSRTYPVRWTWRW